MNEREEFLQYFRPVFTKLVERLETMSEAEVLESLLEVKAAQSIYGEELRERLAETIRARPRAQTHAGWTGRVTREELSELASIQTFFNSVEKLKAKAAAKARPVGRRSHFGLLEDALNERLKLLQSGQSGDS